MYPKYKQIILASRNQGKIRELKNLLGDSWSVVGLDDPDFSEFTGEIEETGTTFRENALIKARAVHQQCGGFVLADDSGIECDDLEGAPGVYSARFAGPKATDEQNNAKLVELLQAAQDPNLRARYVCVLALINPVGEEFVVEETCEGIINFEPKGSGGFGYDPYFYLPDYSCTMAELPLEEKNKISHRGKALRKIAHLLE